MQAKALVSYNRPKFSTKDLDKTENLKHWENWSENFGTSLKATTKSSDIKRIEINTIVKYLQSSLANRTNGKNFKVLEVGCGNGYNLSGIRAIFPEIALEGIDYSPKMIENARLLWHENNKDLSFKEINFYKADATSLDECEDLSSDYDFIFTDRCLINLLEEGQVEVCIKSIFSKLKPGGIALFIENFIETRELQNDIRELAGLPRRDYPEFNKFLIKSDFVNEITKFSEIMEFKSISSLHDFILYIITPLLNDGSVDYDSDLMKPITDLILNSPEQLGSEISINYDMGQNCVLVAEKS